VNRFATSPEDCSMYAPRSATASLIALLIIASPLNGRQRLDAPRRQRPIALRRRLATMTNLRQPHSPDWANLIVATRSAYSPIAILPPAHRLRASSIVVLAGWRNRIKSVLEETNPNIVDDFDVGPVAIPEQPTRSRSVELIDPRPPSAVPLRC
jgi:hypothetical protein